MKNALVLVLGLISLNAFAGDASDISWSCSKTVGADVTTVSIQDGVATVEGYNRLTAMTPITFGQFDGLETFGGGDFIGVKSSDGSFSLIGGSLEYVSDFNGETVHLSGLHCVNR